MDAQFNIITEMRGTIFAPQIIYNTDNMTRILGLLNPSEGYVPSIRQQQPSLQINNGGITINSPSKNPEWELLSSDRKQRIVFGEQKIDIIRQINNNIIGGEESQFTAYCSSIFSLLIEEFNIEATRLAFAPSYVAELSEHSDITHFSNSIFCKKAFMGSSLDNCNFNNVFRVDVTINGKNIKINFVSVFSDGNKIETKNNVTAIRNCLFFNIDINTLPGVGYKFNLDDVKYFFENKVVELNSQFYELYC